MAELNWLAHKDEIIRLYIEEDRPLVGKEGVIDTIEQRHQFTATKSQYETRFRTWGVRKNLKASEWCVVAHHIRKRKEREESEVLFNDVRIPSKRVHRETRRYRSDKLSNVESINFERLPDGVTLKTPPLLREQQTDFEIGADGQRQRSYVFHESSDPETSVMEIFPPVEALNEVAQPPQELRQSSVEAMQSATLVPTRISDLSQDADLDLELFSDLVPNPSNLPRSPLEPLSVLSDSELSLASGFNVAPISLDDMLEVRSHSLEVSDVNVPISSFGSTRSVSTATKLYLSTPMTALLRHFMFGQSHASSPRIRSLISRSYFSPEHMLGSIILNSSGRGMMVDNSQLESQLLLMLKDNNDIISPLATFLESFPEPLRGAFADRLFPVAIEAKNCKAVSVLLSFGANVNQVLNCPDESSQRKIIQEFTPVGRAAWLHDLQTVQELVQRGADVHTGPLIARYHSEETEGALSQMLRSPQLPLEMYVKQRKEKTLRIVKFLGQLGSKVTPLIMTKALESRNFDLVHYLFSLGLDGSNEELITGGNMRKLTANFEDDQVLQILHLVQGLQTLWSSFHENRKEAYWPEVQYEPEQSLGSCIVRTGTMLDLTASSGLFKSSRFLIDIGLMPTYHTLVYAILGKAKALAKELFEAGLNQNVVVHLTWVEGSLAARDTRKLWVIDTSSSFVYKADVTPFCAAILAEDHDMVSFLQNRGTLCDMWEDTKFYPAVTAASSLGHISLLKQLFALKSDIKGKRLGKASLEAIIEGHVDIAMMMVQRGADPLYMTGLGASKKKASERSVRQTILGEAITARHLGLTIVCLEALSEDFETFLNRQTLDDIWWHAINWGNERVIGALDQMLPDYDLRIVTSICHQNTGLARRYLAVDHSACLCRHQSDAYTLHDASDFANDDSKTPSKHFIYHLIINRLLCPLSAALYCRSEEMITFLISARVDVDCRSVWLCALRNRKFLPVIVSEFQRRSPGKKSNYVNEALTVVCLENSETDLQSMVGICDVNYLTPFPQNTEVFQSETEYTSRWQVRKSRFEVGQEDKCSVFGSAILFDKTKELGLIRQTLAAGGNLQQVATSGQLLPLEIAITTGSVPKVRFLVTEGGAIVNALPRPGFPRTPLQLACEKGHYDVVEYLINEGADPDSAPATRGGGTALQLAAIRGFVGIVELLIDHGADINAPAGPIDGRTALEGAAEHGQTVMVHYLIQRGVRVTGDGAAQLQRAIKFAQEEKHPHISRYLESLQYPVFTLE